MAFVQVKNTLQTWRIAAFIVAFFSSFFSYADIDFSKLDGKPPQTNDEWIYICTAGNESVTGMESSCTSFLEGVVTSTDDRRNASCSVSQSRDDPHGIYIGCAHEYSNNGGETWVGTEGFFGWFNGTSVGMKACPSDEYPGHTVGHDSDGDGQPDLCFHPNDIRSQIEEKNELDKNEDYCKELALDSGNNTASSTCYTAYNGASCSMTKVDMGDASYYKGTGNNPLGCGNSPDTPHDSSGTGSDKDGCIYSGGTNYCKANKDKHCSSVGGTEICDEGCINDGTTVFCDVERHNDVGEGESDTHDGDGTCSVIAASSSKGFCEDMGGDWDSTQDATETACPVGTGTCSTPTAGHCGACLDDGGVWTPDNAVPTSEEAKATIEVSALVKKTNEKLTAIEHGQRETMETTVSTIKSGNGKIVAALEDLTKITKDKATGAAAAKEEKETYTTTTGEVDKTAFNTLFDAASTAALKVENVAKELEIKNLMHSFISEGKALLTITAVGSGGYAARNLTMSQGTFDMSLSRFAFFFGLLAAPIMLICTVYAGLILLGKNS